MDYNRAKELIAVFPEAFKCDNEKMPFSMFGFECGDGWFEILKQCFKKMRHVSEEMELPVVIHQVKEKYGTLRIYLDAYYDEIDKIIDEAISLSEKTCEECGAEASLSRRGGWYSVTCDECYKSCCES